MMSTRRDNQAGAERRAEPDRALPVSAVLTPPRGRPGPSERGKRTAQTPQERPAARGAACACARARVTGRSALGGGAHRGARRAPRSRPESHSAGSNAPSGTTRVRACAAQRSVHRPHVTIFLRIHMKCNKKPSSSVTLATFQGLKSRLGHWLPQWTPQI